VASRFAAVETIVYDEADRLLEHRFKRELDGIIDYLPDKEPVPQQAMMFSATVSKQIKQAAAKAMKKGYHFVSTLLADEVNTHEHGTLPVRTTDIHCNPVRIRAPNITPHPLSRAHLFGQQDSLHDPKLPQRQRR